MVVDHGALTIKVNGITRVNALMQTGTKGGRVGFVTHNTPANFDDMLVGSPFGEQLFKDDFSSGLNPRWSTSSKIGVVTHWSKGQFDNVIVRDDPAR